MKEEKNFDHYTAIQLPLHTHPNMRAAAYIFVHVCGQAFINFSNGAASFGQSEMSGLSPLTSANISPVAKIVLFLSISVVTIISVL